MPLRDVTHVVFDRGTGAFNEAAALEAYHLVAKMDDAEAAEFVFHVVNEVVENTITENRDLVQKHLDATIAKALVYADLDAVAGGLNAEERAEVKKQLLSAVSKAWDPKEHPRGQGGRFSVDPNHRIDKPEAERMRAAGEGDIPSHPDFGDMSKEERERFRGQYAQIAHHLGSLSGEKDLTLNYGDGSTRQVSAVSAAKLAAAINPHQSQNVVGGEITDYKPTVSGRVADLTRSLGSGADYIATGKPTMPPPDGNSTFAQQWYTAHPTNSSQAMYNRIGAGSQLLESVSLPGSKLQAAAKFGSFVGQHGPSAEQVFGPPARRMAYRYRGTERSPARDLVQEYGDAVNRGKQGGAAPMRRPGEDLSAYEARVSQTHAERTPTWSEREAGREAIIDWLRAKGRAPDRKLSTLQLAAGHTPPSEGVLLNADGQIVTTAVGAADDWYLPFNLKHLASLKGGEYIRSRSTGGLTTEDIYTGLMTGARRVTVVSRSGVYSIEFDPELRGGRRNNDKALRMTKRYGELLDAVQSGKVERQNLDSADLAQIRGKVDQMYPGANAEVRRAAITALIQERKDNPASIDADIEELDEQRRSLAETRELSTDEKTAFDRDRFRLLAQREYFYNLNGLGYKAAQEALKEQFPYYIASANTTWTVGRSAPFGRNDPGYVEMGALRPTAARANLFGGAMGPSGRIHEQKDAISARTADRAKPLVDRYGRNSGDAPAAEDGTDEPKSPSGSGGSGARMPKINRSEAELKAEAERSLAMQNAAMVVRDGLDSWIDNLVDDGKVLPQAADAMEYHKKYADDRTGFALEMRKPGAAEKFAKAVKQAAAKVITEGFKYPGQKDMEKAMGPEGGGKWDYGRATVDPRAIYDFPDLTPEEKVAAPQQPLMLKAGTAGTASPEDLVAQVVALAKLDEAVRAYASVPVESRHSLIEAKLDAEGLKPSDERGKQMMRDMIIDPKARERAMKLTQIQRRETPVGALATKSVPPSLDVAAMDDPELSRRLGEKYGHRYPTADEYAETKRELGRD